MAQSPVVNMSCIFHIKKLIPFLKIEKLSQYIGNDGFVYYKKQGKG